MAKLNPTRRRETMVLLILSILWLVTVGALIGRAVIQFWAYGQVGEESAPPRGWQRVSVIVPARNEGRNAERCLRALLAQDYPAALLDVILVDDASTDDTADIARSMSRQDPRLHIVQGTALPTGWTGKPHACWQGALACETNDPDWLCFIDCDTIAAPALMRCAVGDAEARGLDLLSLEPFQELGSFWERVIFSAGFLLLAYSQDLRRVNDPSRREAVANGQFILVRRRVYDAVGGHRQVRREISEDSALARLVKQAGFRIRVEGGESVLRTRMYQGLVEIWQGVSRSLIDMIGGTTKTALFAALGLILAAAALALPILAFVQLINPHEPSAVAWASFASAMAASVALFGVHIGAAIRLRIPFWYGLLFPLGYAMGAPLAAYSIWIRARHRIIWKGRAYAMPGAQA